MGRLTAAVVPLIFPPPRKNKTHENGLFPIPIPTLRHIIPKPQVGDNLFVHAGLLPEHIRGAASGEAAARGGGQGGTVADVEEVMEKLNADTCAWLLGKRAIPEEIWQSDSPLWTRVYSDPDSRDIDATARDLLEEVGVGQGWGVLCLAVRSGGLNT